jgi:uncharacterized protein (TIGR03437 family)
MSFRCPAFCGLVLLLSAVARAQPISIMIPAVGDNDFFVTDYSSCSVAATTTNSNPSIASITPTSATFSNGQVEFNITGLENGMTVITITYNLSGTGCEYGTTQIVNTLDVTVGPTGGGPPPVTGLANNYSYILNGLPNYGIAQGSIFDIFGTGLAPSSTPLQSVPLSTSLAGVTVTVTVNNTTTNVILYYVTPNQIAGILPSNTPVGTGKLSVFNGGTLVGSTPILVVESAFGILTLNGLGTGPAAAFDVSNNYVGFTNALNPGDYVILWGTGVGPVPAGTDETVKQTPANLTNVPFKAWIGGVEATVYYHGRSQFPGLDQVILIVPKGVTPGCYVSVVGQSGNIDTNFASLPIADTGRTCNEPVLGLSASVFQSIASGTFSSASQDQAHASSGTFAGGFIGIDSSTLSLSGMGASTDVAGAQFFNLTATQFNALPMPLPSLGSCTVLPRGENLALVPSLRSWFAPVASKTGLDAGAIVVTGPLGSEAIPETDEDFYDAISTTLSGSFIPESGGSFTFDNGSGGSGVGKFSASVAIGAGGILNWTNESSITTINRANGVTVNWSGAPSNTFVIVSGSSASQQAPLAKAGFFCSVPASAGTFTVPSYVLLALPAAGNGLIPPDSLHVTQATLGQSFSAPPLNVGIIMSGVTYIDPVTYQ